MILCIISTSGNIFWNENTNDAELWTPYGSPVSSKFDYFSLKFGHVFVNWNFWVCIQRNELKRGKNLVQFSLKLFLKNSLFHSSE